MKHVSLSKNKYVIVDDCDFIRVSQHKWHYTESDAPGRGYPRRTIYNADTCGYSHEMLHTCLFGPLPKGYVYDHKNGNTLDYRRCNIRIANKRQNSVNRAMQRNNTSGYTGVWFHKRQKKWIAQIRIKGQKLYLGTFDSPIAASKAYQTENRIRNGRFARLAQQQEI